MVQAGGGAMPHGEEPAPAWSRSHRTPRRTAGARWAGSWWAIVGLAMLAGVTGLAVNAQPAGPRSGPVESERGRPAPASTRGEAACAAHPVAWVELIDACDHVKRFRPCQTCGVPGAECSGTLVGSTSASAACGSIPWELLAHGEYIGPPRVADVPGYWLRVGDQLECVYRVTREETNQPYELNVGDRIRVESVNDPALDRELVVQPDGMVTLRMLGQVRAARRTVEELRGELEERYRQYLKVPAITVTPVTVNTRLEDLRAALDGQCAPGGRQTQRACVGPDGTIQLPAIGSTPAQGLSLDELKQEIDERYAQIVPGIDVTPRLLERAPRYLFVLGEVRRPGRFTLEAPTTVMQALALAGGWHHGSQLRQVVVFRRTENWQLIATTLDLRDALLGKSVCPAQDIWLRDSDIVLVPKSRLLHSNDMIDLIFTRGIYGLLPRPAVRVDFDRWSAL